MTVYAPPPLMTMEDEPAEADIGLTDLSLPQSPTPNARPRLLARSSSGAAAQAPRRHENSPGLGMINGQFKSSSSPTLAERPLPDMDDGPTMLTRRRLSRSKTLPRIPRPAHRTQLSLDGLSMGVEKVAKLRRWILSLVTGT